MYPFLLFGWFVFIDNGFSVNFIITMITCERSEVTGDLLIPRAFIRPTDSYLSHFDKTIPRIWVFSNHKTGTN